MLARKDIFYSGSIINLEHCGELVVARNKSFVSIKVVFLYIVKNFC